MGERTLHFIVPGDLDTRTGGYGYDRRIIAGLRQHDWTVQVASLAGDYPFPSDADRAGAAALLAGIPDRSCVLVDGLAFGVVPAEARKEQTRLQLVALVHHPLGLETGLDVATSERLLESERNALTSVRGVVVTSRGTVAAVKSLGVPPGRIAIVEPGTDVENVAPGSRGGPTRLLCVASVIPRKGHDTLFDALERLTHLEWHLTCAGSLNRESSYASGLADRVREGPLSGRVTFAGELAGASLAIAYDTADLFVLPTRYEGYGMAVAEALARGIPVVSTATGAIAELVGVDAGVLVPPGDPERLARALGTLLTDAAVLSGMRHGALRARALLPSWAEASTRMGEALLRFTGS
jgi:glycosyltransferase involved in cell wall biosynthesis